MKKGSQNANVKLDVNTEKQDTLLRMLGSFCSAGLGAMLDNKCFSIFVSVGVLLITAATMIVCSTVIAGLIGAVAVYVWPVLFGLGGAMILGGTCCKIKEKYYPCEFFEYDPNQDNAGRVANLP